MAFFRGFYGMNYLEDENLTHTVPAIYAISDYYWLSFPYVSYGKIHLSQNIPLCDTTIFSFCSVTLGMILRSYYGPLSQILKEIGDNENSLVLYINHTNSLVTDEHIIELKRQCDELGMIKSDHSYAETTPEIIKTIIMRNISRKRGEEKESCLRYLDEACTKIKFIY